MPLSSILRPWAISELHHWESWKWTLDGFPAVSENQRTHLVPEFKGPVLPPFYLILGSAISFPPPLLLLRSGLLWFLKPSQNLVLCGRHRGPPKGFSPSEALVQAAHRSQRRPSPVRCFCQKKPKGIRDFKWTLTEEEGQERT